HHDRCVHPDALVSAKGHAASILAIALLPWNPARFVSDSLKHRLGPGIPEMSQAERQRVDAGGVGKFVHDGFDREDVSVCSQRSERSVSHRRIEQEMVSDLLPRQFVVRYRIAVSVAERLGNMRKGSFDKGRAQIPSGEKVHTAGLTRPHRMTVA